jgi:hypothetical protein
VLCFGRRLVVDDVGIGDGRVAFIDDQRDVEGGLEGRLVEAGKGAAGVGRLKLSDGVVALGGLGEIEAAQLVVEDAGVAMSQLELACRKLLAEIEGGLLLSASSRLWRQRLAIQRLS